MNGLELSKRLLRAVQRHLPLKTKQNGGNLLTYSMQQSPS
jgi:hypothetical protein